MRTDGSILRRGVEIICKCKLMNGRQLWAGHLEDQGSAESG